MTLPETAALERGEDGDGVVGEWVAEAGDHAEQGDGAERRPGRSTGGGGPPGPRGRRGPRHTTTMVVTSTGLSAVPRESMPARTRLPGAWSMTSPPTDPTRDWPGLPVAESSSPTPRATPAEATPASRARPA